MGKKGGASGLVPKPVSNTAKALPVEAPSMKKKQGDSKPAAGQKTEKKKKCSEIDDIFGLAAGGDPEAAVGETEGDTNSELALVAARIKKAREEKAKAEGPQDKGKKSKLQGNKDDLFGGDSGKNRKRTEEGYAIYTEEELRLGGNGGDTELCPFDCDCCF